MASRSRLTACLIAAVALGVVTPTGAQPAPDEPALKQEARDLYAKAIQRYRSGQFAQARATFLAAWALEQHWSIALGLGDCELRLNRYQEAATHLAIALRDMPPNHESRERATAAMREVRLHVAELRFDVDVDGVELFVDGKAVGRSPLPTPVFVDAGTHEVEGRLPNREPSRTTIDARIGGTYPVRFVMAPPASPPVSPPDAGTPDTDTPEQDAGATAEADAGTETTTDTRTIVTLTGAGLTLVAAGFGLAYTLKAGSASDDIDSLQKRIDTELGQSGCYQSASPLCTELEQRFDDRDTARSTAQLAWVFTGVLAGGTVAAYFLWPAATEKQSSSGPRWTLIPAPVPGGAAISIEGSLP